MFKVLNFRKTIIKTVGDATKNIKKKEVNNMGSKENPLVSFFPKKEQNCVENGFRKLVLSLFEFIHTYIYNYYLEHNQLQIY